MPIVQAIMSTVRRLVELPQQFDHLLQQRQTQHVSKFRSQCGAYADSKLPQVEVAIIPARHATSPPLMGAGAQMLAAIHFDYYRVWGGQLAETKTRVNPRADCWHKNAWVWSNRHAPGGSRLLMVAQALTMAKQTE